MPSYPSLTSLVADLCAIPAVSGKEDRLGRYVKQRLAPISHRLETDAMGNLICSIHPDPKTPASPVPKVMITAHMDEIGLTVQWIEESGALRVLPVGDVDIRNVLGQRVTVHGKQSLPGIVGTIPPHLTAVKDRQQLPPWNELFVDVGLPADEIRSLIRPGDVITFEATATPLAGNRLTGKALDNRVGLAAAITAFESLAAKKRSVEVVFVATTQEELGMRGAEAAAHTVSPDVAIVLDVGFAPMPGVSRRESIAMGSGPAIAVGPNFHPGLAQALQRMAEEKRLRHQIEVLPGHSGTDAWVIQVSGGGVPTALLSIPLRYMHSTVETVDVADIAETATLISQFCTSLTESEIRGWQGDRFVTQAE